MPPKQKLMTEAQLQALMAELRTGAATRRTSPPQRASAHASAPIDPELRRVLQRRHVLANGHINPLYDAPLRKSPKTRVSPPHAQDVDGRVYKAVNNKLFEAEGGKRRTRR